MMGGNRFGADKDSAVRAVCTSAAGSLRAFSGDVLEPAWRATSDVPLDHLGTRPVNRHGRVISDALSLPDSLCERAVMRPVNFAKLESQGWIPVPHHSRPVPL